MKQIKQYFWKASNRQTKTAIHGKMQIQKFGKIHPRACFRIKWKQQKHQLQHCKQLICISDSSKIHLEVFDKKSYLKIFAKFTGKDLCRSLFLITLQSLGTEKRLRHSCLPVNFNRILRKPFLQNTSRWVLCDLFKGYNKNTKKQWLELFVIVTLKKNLKSCLSVYDSLKTFCLLVWFGLLFS